MEMTLSHSRAYSSEVASVVQARKEPQINAKTAHCELSRVIDGSITVIDVNKNDRDYTRISIIVGKKAGPIKTKETGIGDAKLVIKTGRKYFRCKGVGPRTNELVQAVKRAYFNWQANI